MYHNVFSIKKPTVILSRCEVDLIVVCFGVMMNHFEHLCHVLDSQCTSVGEMFVQVCCPFFFFFAILRFELRAYMLSHSTSPFL
jgi:hypothetical protein